MASSHNPQSHESNRRQKLARRGRLIAAASLIMLAFPASALAAQKFTIKAHFPNHTPTANQKWPITLDVTKGKTKLSGSVKYEFKFQGSVVAHRNGHKFKNGVYTDKLTFTPDGVGVALTLVVQVTTKYGTESINWAVTTQQ